MWEWEPMCLQTDHWPPYQPKHTASTALPGKQGLSLFWDVKLGMQRRGSGWKNPYWVYALHLKSHCLKEMRGSACLYGVVQWRLKMTLWEQSLVGRAGGQIRTPIKEAAAPWANKQMFWFQHQCSAEITLHLPLCNAGAQRWHRDMMGSRLWAEWMPSYLSNTGLFSQLCFLSLTIKLLELMGWAWGS